MEQHKFDATKLEKLNNPERIQMVELPKIMKELNLPTGSTIVDIGAGTGLFSEAFLKRIPDSTGYAFDISPVMVEWLNENRVPQLDGRLIAKLMQENQIPLNDGLADFAFMILVHHELVDASKLLEDVHRILKNGGKLLICDWKEGKHHHFVPKSKIIQDLEQAHFTQTKEIDASEEMVCFIATK